MTINEAKANIGVKVERRTGILEQGVITSVNDTYVFVRYKGDEHSKATYPDELNFYQRLKI